MKKQNPITEGMLGKFMDNLFTNIKNNNRARNQKALKNDPELKRLEAKLADAHDNLKDVIARRKAKLGY
jgi:hypothetical protein